MRLPSAQIEGVPAHRQCWMVGFQRDKGLSGARARITQRRTVPRLVRALVAAGLPDTVHGPM